MPNRRQFLNATDCHIIDTSLPVEQPFQRAENVCDHIRNNIINLHRHHVPSWTNIDEEEWPPVDAWQLAKCFLPPGGCSSRTSFQELDLSDLVGIMQNCVHFGELLSFRRSTISQEPNQLFTKALRLERKILHFPDTDFTDTVLQDLCTTLTSLFDDIRSLDEESHTVSSNIVLRDKDEKLIPHTELVEILKDARLILQSARIERDRYFQRKMDEISFFTKDRLKNLKDCSTQTSEVMSDSSGRLTIPSIHEHHEETNDGLELERTTIGLTQKLCSVRCGEIWKGTWNGTTNVTVKTLTDKTVSKEAFLEEAKLLNKCQHENIVQLHGICSQSDPVFIITEDFQERLLDFLRSNDVRSITLAVITKFANQVASAMAYLENLKIIHMDLEARNVLISNTGNAKVSGFDYAKEMDDDICFLPKDDYPPRWTAPEMITDNKHSIKSVVWSYGVLLFEMVTNGQLPYDDMSKTDMLNIVPRGYRMPRAVDCPDAIYEIMLKCWDKHPELRPTFEYLEHFFKNSSIEQQASVVQRRPLKKGPWEIDRSSLQLIKSTGYFRFGDVWEGKLERTIKVCVKALKPDKEKETFLAEAEIMKQFRNDNLVKLYGICSKGEPVFIVTELLNGTLLDWLRSGEGRYIKTPEMVDCAGQIVSGMEYLERKKIVHADLAARNVFMGTNVCKVGNFSLATVLKGYESELQGILPLPIKWTAPEVFTNGRFTAKADVWSFGILLHELVTLGQTPYEGMTNQAAREMVTSGYRMTKPNTCCPRMYDVMTKCWNAQPEERPTFSYLATFFNGFFHAN